MFKMKSKSFILSALAVLAGFLPQSQAANDGTTGFSWFGTINPTPGLVATDLYTVGTNFDALVYVDLSPIPGWGTNFFAYLRHDNTGSIIGTIDPVTRAALDLGSADSFAVLGGSTVTSIGNTILNGDLGVSPGTTITGFTFSPTPGPGIVNGTTYAGGLVAANAQSGAHTAYNTLAGETSIQNLTGQDLGGLTRVPGVYRFDSSTQLTGTLTLNAGNNPNARFDFLIGSTLGTASSSSVSLINGAQVGNVFRQVGSSATLGAGTSFHGSILADQSITLNNGASGASISGRASALAVLAGFPPQSKAALYLGAADSFAVLGGSTVTSIGNTILNGDLGVSPGTTITGFYPPGIVNGTIYAGGLVAANAHADALNVYNILAGETSIQTLTGQDLGGLTLLPGVYRFDSSAQLTGTLTLNAGNNPDARFDFLIGSTLTTASSSSISLINGAQAGNVFWQVGSSATLGADTSFDGSILADQSITFNTGASMSGRALALNGAVTLDGNEITGVPEPATFWLLTFCASVFGAWRWLAVWRRQQAGRS